MLLALAHGGQETSGLDVSAGVSKDQGRTEKNIKAALMSRLTELSQKVIYLRR